MSSIIKPLDLESEKSFSASTLLKQVHPVIFELSYQGKISYCLPVNHIVSFDQLHEKIKLLISTMQTLVSEADHENEIFSKEEMADGLVAGESGETINYFATLPVAIQAKIQKILAQFCLNSNHPENYLKPQELTPNTLLTLLRGESEILGYAMDKTLYQLFKGQNKEILLLDEPGEGDEGLELYSDEEIESEEDAKEKSELEAESDGERKIEDESMSLLYYWQEEVEPKLGASLKEFLEHDGIKEWTLQDEAP